MCELIVKTDEDLSILVDWRHGSAINGYRPTIVVVVVVVVVVVFASEEMSNYDPNRPSVRVLDNLKVSLFYAKTETLEMPVFTDYFQINDVNA